MKKCSNISNLKTHYNCKLDFQKVDQHTGANVSAKLQNQKDLAFKSLNVLVKMKSRRHKHTKNGRNHHDWTAISDVIDNLDFQNQIIKWL